MRVNEVDVSRLQIGSNGIGQEPWRGSPRGRVLGEECALSVIIIQPRQRSDVGLSASSWMRQDVQDIADARMYLRSVHGVLTLDDFESK